MKSMKSIWAFTFAAIFMFSWGVSNAGGQDYSNGQEDPNKKILKQGLLGAGVGAISASASGGKAGKGALIGAGTNVIGGALLDSLMGGGSSQQQQAPPQPVYYQQAPQPQYQQQQYAPAPQQQQSSRCKQVTYYDSEGNPVKTVEEC